MCYVLRVTFSPYGLVGCYRVGLFGNLEIINRQL